MATVLLVRHGRSTANSAGLLAGWTPQIHLDEEGRRQADELGERVAQAGLRPAVLVSSPLERCQETAHRLTAASGAPLPVVLDEALGECRYGAWTGRPLVELADEPLWRLIQDRPSAARFPDGPQWPGESLAQMSHRAVAAVRAWDERVGREHGEQAVWVAVSHADVIKAVLADALGMHLDAFQRIVVQPASVSAVRFVGGRTLVLTVSSQADLSALRPDPAAPTGGDAVVGGVTGTSSATPSGTPSGAQDGPGSV